MFALQNFKGAFAPKKLYPRYYFNLKTRHVAKSCGVSSTTPYVIGAQLLKFKPILDPPLNKKL